MTSHSARERNYERDRQYPDKPDKYGEVAPPERITNDFYKNHKFYRILAVEHHAKSNDIAMRGKLLMLGLDHDSPKYKQLKEAMDCLVNGGGMRRAFYDRDGDLQPHNNSYVPESQKDTWRHMGEPEYSLPTHNQFGFASTSNPYLVSNEACCT